MALAQQPASDDRPPGVDRLPTLTEVVELGLLADVQAPRSVVQLPAEAAHESAAAALPQALQLPDAQTLVTQVLAELAPRIEMLLDTRLREAMAPALARAADGLIRDARDSLPAALRELVEDAVARALQRRSAE